jgi:hypothetical protein
MARDFFVKYFLIEPDGTDGQTEVDSVGLEDANTIHEYAAWGFIRTKAKNGVAALERIQALSQDPSRIKSRYPDEQAKKYADHGIEIGDQVLETEWQFTESSTPYLGIFVLD